MVVAERRLELLKLEGLGLSQPEIVKQVTRSFKFLPEVSTETFNFAVSGSLRC